MKKHEYIKANLDKVKFIIQKPHSDRFIVMVGRRKFLLSEKEANRVEKTIRNRALNYYDAFRKRMARTRYS